MSLRTIAVLVVLAALAVVGFVLYRLVALNFGERAQLVFDLYFWAWQFPKPVPVVVLIGGGFAAGAFLGSMFAGGRALLLSRRVRRLEQELAFSGKTTQGEWR